MKRVSKNARVEWKNAPDIKKRVLHITKTLNIDWLRTSKVYCVRSNNSKSRAQARIWGLPKIWQQALDANPAYIIEVLSEKFDDLPQLEQDKVILHEIAHIPKNFSGSLLPHVRKRGKRNFHDRVGRLVKQYLRSGN